jgi:hypothetical protein
MVGNSYKFDHDNLESLEDIFILSLSVKPKLVSFCSTGSGKMETILTKTDNVHAGR